MPVPSPKKSQDLPVPESGEPQTPPDSKRSEFSQRLASFGLGAIEEHLLTKSILPKHHRKR